MPLLALLKDIKRKLWSIYFYFFKSLYLHGIMKKQSNKYYVFKEENKKEDPKPVKTWYELCFVVFLMIFHCFFPYRSVILQRKKKNSYHSYTLHQMAFSDAVHVSHALGFDPSFPLIITEKHTISVRHRTLQIFHCQSSAWRGLGLQHASHS